MFRWTLLTLLALALTAGASSPTRAAEGWSVGFTHSGGGAEVTLLLGADNLRLRTAGLNEEVLLDRSGLTLIDHADQSYMVVTYDQLQSTLGLMADAMRGVREAQRRVLASALEEMPPDRRAEVEAQLEGLGPASPDPTDFEFRPQTETTVLAGLTARRHLVTVRGEALAEAWLTSEIDPGPLPEIVGRLERLAPLQDEVDPASIRMLRLLPGFVLKVTDLTGSGSSLLVHRADRRSVSAADFAPPAGYGQKTLSLDAFRN